MAGNPLSRITSHRLPESGHISRGEPVMARICFKSPVSGRRDFVKGRSGHLMVMSYCVHATIGGVKWHLARTSDASSVAPAAHLRCACRRRKDLIDSSEPVSFRRPHPD